MKCVPVYSELLGVESYVLEIIPGRNKRQFYASEKIQGQGGEKLKVFEKTFKPILKNVKIKNKNLSPN